MSDEVTKLILADTAISAVEQTPPTRKHFFGEKSLSDRLQRVARIAVHHYTDIGAPNAANPRSIIVVHFAT